ncbi:MAG TPA: chemotaxis protein CheC [Opitutaceae bacterium]|nr:chemotaxis protein CheC [Opitutaceae bacterium]
MELSPHQNDAISELINIGYGRAAQALSELTGHRITLQVPRVSVHRIDEVTPLLEGTVYGEVASVNQLFSGPIAGNSLLLLDEEAAITLVRLISDEHTAAGGLDAGAREIITEVGNILLNACLGVFGNLLKVQISFSMPRLQVEKIQDVMRSVQGDSSEVQHALMIHTRFQLLEGAVSGYMVIILGLASLDCLLERVESWEQGVA